MRLTQHTDYSLRVLIHLALKKGELATIREISEAYGVSKNHLTKVVQNLVRSGYVESVRGKRGGLRLNRPPEEVSLGEIAKKMEPDFSLVECQRPENQCVITPDCTLPRVLTGALHAFMDHLNQFTLQDLIPEESQTGLAEVLLIEPLTS